MAKIILNDVRLSFADLWTSVGFDDATPKDQYKYGATFLIEKGSENDKKIKQAISAAAKEKWGAKAETILKQIEGNNNKYAYQDGDLKEYDGYAGNMSIKASTKQRPITVDKARRPVTEDDGIFYSGCYVNASIDIYTYDIKSGKGITAGLNGIQFVRDGDAFGAGPKRAEDMFEDLSEGSDAEDFV